MDVGTSQDLMASSSPESTGWHRKWLLLCAALVWLFFLRFRLLGWLLSQLLTLAMRVKLPRRLRAHAHIQYVTARPLELGHIAIHCNQNHWRIVCSRISVRTFVLEFFRSFVQKKMLILSIEDVYVDVFRVDDELLREFVRLQAATNGKQPTSNNPSMKKSNPMGFMRFVDFQVRKLHVQIDAFETRSRLRCSELKIDIPQVFAAQNYLHLNVAASSIVVSSCLLESHAHGGSNPTSHGDGSSGKTKESTEGGLSCELTNWSMVLDVRLTDQQVLACNVEGDADEPAYFHVSTSYVEKLLAKKMELIRQDLFPIPKELYRQEQLPSIGKVADANVSSPFRFRVVNMPVTIDLLHRPPGSHQVPLQICTHMTKLEYQKDLMEKEAGATNGSTERRNTGGVQISMDWTDLKISDSLTDNGKQVALLSRLQLEMKRDDAGKGTMGGVFDAVELALDPRLCEVLHSLVVFPDVVDDYEKATLQLMHEKAAARSGQQVSPLRSKIPVTWKLKLEIQSWDLQAWLGSVEGRKSRDLEAHGQRTTVQSVLPPKATGAAVKHHVELAEVSVAISLPPASGVSSTVARKEDHSLHFVGVCVSTAKSATPATATRSMELKLSATSISLNDYARGLCLQDIRQLPGLFFSNMVFQLKEVDVNGAIQVEYSISTTEADLTSSHRRHKEILSELAIVASTLDQVRAMLTPPDPPGAEKVPEKAENKALSINIFASAIRLQLLDVDGVSDQVEFNVTETKVAYQKVHTGVRNTATCALLKALWPASSRVVEVIGFRFDQVIELSASEGLMPQLVETESRIDISLSQLRLWLQPDRRLLLLFLKLDELINDKEEAASKPKKTSQQLVNLNCSEIAIDVRDGPSQRSSSVSRNIDFHRFVLNAKISRAYEITDAMQRYLQVTRRDDTCHSRLTDCIQVIGVEGSIQIQSILVQSTVQSTHQAVFSAQEFQLNFAISDVATSANAAASPTYESILLPKILLYDASAVAKEVRLKVSAESSAAAQVILPILQQTFDTRDHNELNSTAHQVDEIPGEWRLRYVGAADFGVEHLTVTVPCEADLVHEESHSNMDDSDPSERFVHFYVAQLACNSRQFQKLAVEFDSLRVVLTERETDDGFAGSSGGLRSVGDDNLPLPLLLLPRTKVDAVIHWRAATSLEPTQVQQFAVSFDLVLRGKPASMITEVPVRDETLVVLNWDYVYPLLVVLLTSDDDDSSGMTGKSTELAAAPPPQVFQCVGVQWNLSLDLIQFAWWDSMSQDAGILIVANDLLSHGIARVRHDSAPQSEPKWVLWETTVYLDLFRAYILREAQAEDGYVALACDALPFEPMPASRFFVETTGTSYREAHSLCGDERIVDSASGPLFGDLGFGIADRLHCEFSRVQYSFCIGTASRLHRLSSSSSDPTGTAPSASNASPPKSPRAWTQSVRAKLARLKRRTTSMDNMLLNDGSRPIQVDSMKLLWTIETRDCAFYMIAVTGDSVEAIMEANKECQQQAQGVPVRPMHSGNAEKTDWASKDQRGAVSQPATVVDDTKAEAARSGRRGSTRESLLDLLHQGKLGKKDSPTLHADSSFHSSSSRVSDGEKSSRFETEEMHLPKAIKHKKYTLDVHDAQINMLEETSRSSALIASKHIHLEIGFDETSTTTITTLKLECVTGHVAPVDVDITAGVLWYSYAKSSTQFSQSPRGSFTNNPMLLKQVMDECSLAITYSQVLASGATAVEADMSSLQLSTDRHQFYQLLNVLRHVLLAPPTVIRRIARSTGSRRDNVSESNATIAGEDIAVFPTTPTHSMSAHSTKKLHAQLVEELRHRDSKMLGMYRSAPVVFKHISFRSAGCVFRLRTSPESTGGDHEFVEIRAEGLTGSHMYFLSQSTKFVLNLQWMEINNLRPGSSSIAFEDAMAVLKAKLLIDQRHQGTNHQKGMLTVRAESGPQMRVLGQKLRVLDVLEVSIFPEIPNMIVIQLAADFYELVYKFFFEAIHSNEHQEVVHSEHVLFGKKGSSSSMAGPIPISISTTTTNSGSVSMPQSPLARSRAYTAPSSPPHPVTIRRKSIQASSAVGSESMLSASSVSATSVPSGEATADEDDSSADGHELFYFKYVRIGNVRLRINCNGFFVNLTNFDLDLPPYVCQSKLCTWKKLLQKFESHLKWHVTKESASTGLSHFKNKLLKWTPTSSGDKKDKHKKEEDSATLNAQVLFGPYSGSH